VEGNGDEIIAVQRSDLTNLEKARLSLYDNRTSELAEWDTNIIEVLHELADCGLGGVFDNIFTDRELGALLGDDYEPDEEPSGERELAGKAIVVCPKCQHEFKP
jgi:hypothetical protein